MNAGIYVRISQDRAGEGLGVARQEKLCRQLADRLGWHVAHVYRDNDSSAFSGKPRPAYLRMLDDAKSGHIGAILVLDTDRLTRHPRELEDVIDLADRAGIALANVSGEIDLSTSQGRLIARITGAVARQESEHKSERIRRKQDELAQAGKWAGGPRRFGYTPDMSALVEPEALAIREGVRAVLDLDRSWTQVAREWNDLEVLSPRGSEWRAPSVRRTLTAPHLAGLRAHRGEVVGEAEWPPIISRADHARLSALVRRGRPTLPARRLLTGFLVCGRCGATLTHSSTGARRRIYRCWKRPGHEGCGGLSLSAEPAEAVVRQAVLQAFDTPGYLAALEAETSGDTSDVVAQLDDVDRRRAEAAQMFADGEIGRSEWMAVRDRLERLSADLNRQLETSRPAVLLAHSGGSRLAASWDDPEVDDGWRRAVIGLVIERIVVAPAAFKGAPFDPARIVSGIVWKD